MINRPTFHLLRILLPAAVLPALLPLFGSAPRHTGIRGPENRLEISLPLPGGTAAAGGNLFLAPVTRRSLYISASESSIAVTVRISARHPRSRISSLRPVLDISLPDTAEYGAPDVSDVPRWTVAPLGHHDGRFFFRVDVECGPAKNGTVPAELSVTIDGADLQRGEPPRAFPAHRDEAAPLPVPEMTPAPLSAGNDDEMPRLAVPVSRAGLVRVTAAMLKDAGWNLSRIDPDRITVTCAGKTIPVFMHGDEDGRFTRNDYLEFFGERHWRYGAEGLKSLDIYDERGLYLVEYRTVPGPRFGQEEAVERDVPREQKRYPRSAPYTQHEEVNAYFHRLPYAVNVADADYWLYAPPIQGGQKREFTFTIEDPDAYAVTPIAFRIRMRGQTSITGPNRVDVFLNSALAASGEWDGITDILLTSREVSPSSLAEGANTLSIANLSPNGPLSQLMLDWFEITYPRLLRTESDYLRFQPPESSIGSVCRFELEGFSSPEIEIFREPGTRFLLPDISAVTDTSGVVSYTAVFEDEISSGSAVYHARSGAAVVEPDTIRLLPQSDILTRLSGADYVIIHPSDTLGEEILRPLIDLRESQGHRVLLADLQTVYDEFNFSIRSPEAIRRLLRAVYDRRLSDDLFLLLVGDGLVNNRVPPENEGHHMPVMITQTVKYGAAATDHWYTLLAGDDDIPEMAVGRLPVISAEQLSLVVDKIVGYESASPAPWMNRYLLIGAGGSGGIFFEQSETLIRSTMQPALHPERLYLAGAISDPDVGGTEDLLRHLRDGVMLVNFRGHGGGAIWSDGGLLDLDDVDLLENRERLAVMTSMTCFTGDFSSSRLSLGESLLRDTEAGAVAFWGATGLGWVYNDYYMLTELYEVMREFPAMPLGAMIKEAKTRYLAAFSGDLPSTEVHHYTLLGDPGLRLAAPAVKQPAVLASNSLADTDSLVFAADLPEALSRALVEVITPANRVLSIHEFSDLGRTWRGAVPLPDDMDGSGGARLYVWNESSRYQAHTWAPFIINSSYFDSLTVEPSEPGSRDTLYVRAAVEDSKGVTSCWCRVLSPAPDSLGMAADMQPGHYRTAQPLGPFPAGTLVSFSIVAVNSSGRESVSDTIAVRILSDPDFLVRDVYFSGTSEPEVSAEIVNAGAGERKGVSVLFSDTLSGFSATAAVTLPAYGGSVATVPYAPDPGTWTLSVCVNPDSSEPEMRYSNNCLTKTLRADRFQVTPEAGSLNGSLQGDTLSLDSAFAVCIPPGSAVSRGVLTLGTLPPAAAAAMHADPAGSAVYTMHLTPSDTLAAPMQLFFTRQAPDSLSAVKPYRYDTAGGVWTALPLFAETETVLIASSLFGGAFQLRTVTDTDAPRIEITVKNQLLASGAYVPEEPEILITVSDDGGVDRRGAGITIYLDRSVVSGSQRIEPDSAGNPSSCVINYRPALSSGRHTLRVEAADLHGNRAVSPEVEMIVDEQLQLHYLGNHPNPFKVETVFAYTLTAATKRTSLKIYTVAGTLIRTFETEEMGSADYHEVVWDGHDSWGEDVANGVYFFRLTAAGTHVTREYTGKIAKLR